MGEKMKTYIKQAIIPFIYLLFMAIIALAITSIEDKLLWLKIALGILNLALYFTVVCGACYKEGQQALKIRVANDLEREQIIITGEDRPLKLHEEYKWWKGFFIGGLACAPMLVLLIIHTVLILINPALNGCGVASAFIYMAFFMFFMLGGSGSAENVTPMSPASFYGCLIALPILMVACGVAYYLGAKKIQLQQEAIKAKHREIYGE